MNSKRIPCSKCKGRGCFGHEDDERVECSKCEGTGSVPSRAQKVEARLRAAVLEQHSDDMFVTDHPCCTPEGLIERADDAMRELSDSHLGQMASDLTIAFEKFEEAFDDCDRRYHAKRYLGLKV